MELKAYLVIFPILQIHKNRYFGHNLGTIEAFIFQLAFVGGFFCRRV